MPRTMLERTTGVRGLRVNTWRDWLDGLWVYVKAALAGAMVGAAIATVARAIGCFR